MKRLETIKQNYSRQLEQYRIKNPVLHDADFRKVHICGLCGATVKGDQLQQHMNNHELPIPTGLNYQLTAPFRTVNGLIQRGAKFIKLLVLITSNSSELTVYNGLNLPDWKKLTDTEDVTIRWSEKKRRFVRTLWSVLVLSLIFM